MPICLAVRLQFQPGDMIWSDHAVMVSASVTRFLMKWPVDSWSAARAVDEARGVDHLEQAGMDEEPLFPGRMVLTL